MPGKTQIVQRITCPFWKGAAIAQVFGRSVVMMLVLGCLVTSLPIMVRAQDAGQPIKPKNAKNLPEVIVHGRVFDRDSHYGHGFVMPSNGGLRHVTNLAPVHVFASTNRSPAQDSDPNGCQNKVGKPIQISSGTKLETYPIFALPGEMGLQYLLYYNTATHPSHWTDNFDYSLITHCEDVIDNPTGRCTHTMAYRPDGSSMKFSGGPDASAYHETFENGQSVSNAVATLSRDSGTGNYTLHDEDALTEVYSSAGALLSIKDASGIGWTISATSNGKVITHTDGQTISIVEGLPVQSQQNGQNVLGQVVTVTDPSGQAYVFHYGDAYAPNASINDLASISFPGTPATVISFKYNSYSVPPYTDQLTEVDYNGAPYAYTTYVTASASPYYQWANSTSLADGTETVAIDYGMNGAGKMIATVTNPLGHVSVNTYAGINDQLSSVSNDAVADCGSTVNTREYDGNGNLSRTVDNNGNVHTYTYAANGQLQTETEAYGTSLARTTDYVWDPNLQLNRLSSVIVEGWSKTTYVYNAQNRIASVAVTNLSGNGVANQTLTTSYGYTLYANGMVHTRVVTQPSPNGSDTSTSTYDTLGNLTALANGLGQTTTYSNYNALGEPGHVVGANGNVTDFTYDARGRVATRTTHPNGVATTWTYAYDDFGLLAKVTAPDGEVATWDRDPEMRVTSIGHNDKDGTSVETFGYDANSDVTSDVISRGGVISSSLHVIYDTLARPYKKQGNHGQVTTYSYDGNGNVLSMIDAAGHVTSYQYDALDRVTQKTESGGASPAIPAAAPSLSLALSSNSGNYAVSWTSVGGAVDYRLQERVNSGSWRTVRYGATNGWSASGKTNGSYSYRVQACNATGCGPWSATKTITVSIPTAPATAPVLTAPGSSATGAYSLSWTTVSTASSYKLRQQVNAGSWSIVQSSTATHWSTSGEASGAYGYGVQACNAIGCGPWSATRTVTVTIPSPPQTPSLSVPATSGTGSYTVSWSGVSGAASYSLRRRFNGGAWSVVQSSAATSWNAHGQGTGSYGYEVQACNVGGCSAWSAQRTATVTIPVPIAINGQSYSVNYAIPMRTTASVSIGFAITGGHTWEVFTTRPGPGNSGVVAVSGAVPATASTVKFTWVQQGPPSGYAGSGGSVSNPASSPVALSANPASQYTSGTYGARADLVGMRYQLRVDFFNAAGANVSSSTCTLTATLAGTN